MRTSNVLVALSLALSASCRPAPPGSVPPPPPRISTTPTTVAPPADSFLSSSATIATAGSSFAAPVKAAQSSAAGSSAPAAAATSAAGGSAASSAGSGGYTTFTGDGSAGAGWPSDDKWISFPEAFSANKGDIQSSCAKDGQANDSPSETSDIQSAVTSTASSTGVDARIIFAVIMQESHGCVRVKTTAEGANPGLMQSHSGTTCFGITPCPTDKITQMVQDGAGGVGGSAGLKQGLTAATAGATAQQTYQALRIYNSGSLDSSGNLATNGATPCYASDVANRLSGFVGDSPCALTG